VQKRLLAWFFVVQEIGHAVIELRRELDSLPAEAVYARGTPWRITVEELGRALIRLFAKPDAGKLERALKAAEDAISAAHTTEEPRPTHFESSPLRRIESYLHFIRSTFLEMRPLLVPDRQK
jgi:uncharacterized membrane protein YccC